MKANKIIFALVMVSCASNAAVKDTECKDPQKEWEEKYKSVAMERAPSMFDACNPFADIFFSDFFGDLFDKIKDQLGNRDLFCGYGTDDLFEDSTGIAGVDLGKRPTSSVDNAEDSVLDGMDKVLNDAIKPITKKDTGSTILNNGSNDAIKEVIFN